MCDLLPKTFKEDFIHPYKKAQKNKTKIPENSLKILYFYFIWKSEKIKEILNILSVFSFSDSNLRKLKSIVVKHLNQPKIYNSKMGRFYRPIQMILIGD